MLAHLDHQGLQVHQEQVDRLVRAVRLDLQEHQVVAGQVVLPVHREHQGRRAHLVHLAALVLQVQVAQAVRQAHQE